MRRKACWPRSFETRFRQPRFLVRPFDQRIAQRRDAVGDTLEKLGAHRERQLPVRIERLLRQLTRLPDDGQRAAAENRLRDIGSRGRIERMQWFFLAAHRLAADQHFAGNRHLLSLSEGLRYTSSYNIARHTRNLKRLPDEESGLT